MFDLDQANVETGGLTVKHVDSTRCWIKMFDHLVGALIFEGSKYKVTYCKSGLKMLS